MQRTAVQSETLASVGYDPATQELELEFRRGRVYRYYDVPESVFSWLMRLPHKTGFFNRTIRDAYRYRDVTEPDSAAPPLLDQLRASLEQSAPSTDES